MNLRLILPAAVALCFAASCTPYVEPPPDAPVDPAARKPTAEEQEKIRQQREELKEQDKKKSDALAEKERESAGADPAKPGNTTGGTGEEEAPKPPPTRDIPVARPVPGKPGMVFSPFNNKVIDVKGIPSGRLVADPTYPASEKKHFRVP
jgi:hypothetical protein